MVVPPNHPKLHGDLEIPHFKIRTPQMRVQTYWQIAARDASKSVPLPLGYPWAHKNCRGKLAIYALPEKLNETHTKKSPCYINFKYNSSFYTMISPSHGSISQFHPVSQSHNVPQSSGKT